MELEWEQGRQSARNAAALLGATLGAALGADCFLALERSIGASAVLYGGVIAFCAVKGGALFAGQDSKAGALLALLPILFWGCFANHLNIALAAAPGDPAAVWDALFCLESLTAPDSAFRYWLRLAGLLGMALVVWIVLFLRSGQDQGLAERAARPCRITVDPPPADLEVFLPKHQWVRRFLLQRRIVQGVWLAALFLCGWLGALVGHERMWFCALCGMGVSLLLILSLLGPSGRICRANSVLYARKDGQLWRIALNNLFDLELHVRLSKLAQIWDQLPQTRKSSFRAAIAGVIAAENHVATQIKQPKLEWQSQWEWSVSDRAGTKTSIPKVYPGFAPVPGDAEQVKGPPPLRWINPAVTLLVTAVCLAVGCGVGLQEERRAASVPSEPSSVEHVLPEPTGSHTLTVALAPEEVGWYYLNGLTLLTDDAFQASTTEFLDEENGLAYHIALRYGVEEEAALWELERTEGEDSRYLRNGGDFLWCMGENGVVYRYNLRSTVLPEGQSSHTAVALSERGTLVILTCTHGEEAEAEMVRGTLLYMLENLQFTGPAITEDNYQEQLRPAVSMGFNYCGQAFFKAPSGMFEYDTFLDTFLPCSGKVNYYDGGISMMTKAHGLRVSAAVVPNEGTAMDVVERTYQDLKAAGRQYDEQNLFQDAYNEEGNNACRVAVYYDSGRTRVTVLVAMEESEGYYLLKELTCLPEEIDGEYQAVFKEMEATCGIEVSVMETLGKFSGSQESEGVG